MAVTLKDFTSPRVGASAGPSHPFPHRAETTPTALGDRCSTFHGRPSLSRPANAPSADRPATVHGAGRGATPDLSRVRAIAFDLDCTLIDIMHVKRRACEAAVWALADAGLELDPTRAAGDLFRTSLEVGIDRDDVVDAYLERVLKRPDPRLVEVGRHAFERAEDHHAVPYPRAHRTLLELSRRGYGLSLVSDAPRHRAVGRLQSASLAHFFKPILTVEDSPNGKADPEPFRILLDELGLEAPELLVVGDNPARDVGSARALGCRTVLAAYGLQPTFASDAPEHQPDHRVAWLDELLTLLPGGQRPGNGDETPPRGQGRA